jgi:RHS repeat-associated protein
VPAVTWPAAAVSEVDLPPTAAGQQQRATPVAKTPLSLAHGQGRDAKTGSYSAENKTSAASHSQAKVKVEMLDKTVADKAGIRGDLMRLSPVSGDTTGPLALDLDYRSFAAAYGADYGERLRFVQYPECVLTTPDQPQCETKKPLDSANDAKSGHLTGQVAFAQNNSAQVVAAEASDKGGGGDFAASSLKPAGSWTSGGSTGDFTYSYPIGGPAGPSGTSPSVSLNYSSDSVDGLTSATNNQASQIGDGWTLSGGGFIERSYKSCAEDLGGNNGQTKKGDLCWFSDNATMSFAGGDDVLVKDKGNDKGNSGWHSKSDSGMKIEKLPGAGNGANGGEYWKVTTVDGTQYFFGLNHLPGWVDKKPETQSTWTEPVFGNNAGEPCNQPTFDASSCQQAWRWNLDYVVDTHGNATAYYYDKESNAYAVNEKTATPTSYVRGGYLDRIEYGFNTHVADVYSTPPARIMFDTTERCIPQGTITCDPAQLTKATVMNWKDVPFDLICTEGVKCLNGSPSFFSRKRYTKIYGQVADGHGGWNSVNEWNLAQSFPTTGDGGSPALWLDSITQTGKAGTTPITLPPTTFHAKAEANRVDANSQYTALTRNRIDAIGTSTGGTIAVKYADAECKPGATMAPENNTLACYPVYWTPGGATDPILDWFNKYRVTDVTEDGNTKFSQQILTHYDYLGGTAWHHDDNPLSDPKYRTWSQFRGYGDVKITKGQVTGDPSGPRTVTDTRYLRGMDGDAQPNGGHRSVSVASAWGDSVTDSQQFAGFVRESLTYLDGKVISDTLNDPWTSAAVATDNDGVQAFYTGTGTTRGRTWIDATQQWRVNRKVTTFGDYGLPTTSEEDGLLNGTAADPAQATCTTTRRLPNPDIWLIDVAQQVTKYSGTCGTPVGSGNIISDVKNSFDQKAFGVLPTAGGVTQTDELDTWPNGGVESFQSPTKKVIFDAYGRSVSVADARGVATTMAYTPVTGGPVTQVATTTPQISDTNTTKFTATKIFDAVSGAVLTEINNSGLRTDATYDALARVTAVWAPGHSQAQNALPTTTYEYSVTNAKGAMSYVATKAILANSTYTATYALIDGLGRNVQTQAPTPFDAGGRVLIDTFYDSQVRTYITHNAYWNGDSGPTKTAFVTQDNAVPNSTFTTYDSAGRSIAAAYVKNGTEQWRTSTKYDGDRSVVIPPAGGVATATVVNGLGQNTQLVEFADRNHANPGDPGDVTTYTYTPAGQVASITDATGKNVWTTNYDLHGRKSSSTDPDAGASAFTYDAVGRLATSADAEHRTLAYTYDNLGRKTAEYKDSTSGTKLADWTYDTVQAGLPTGSTRYDNGRAYTTSVLSYDMSGRATKTRLTVPASETGLGGNYDFSTAYDTLTGAVSSTTSPQKGGLALEQITHDYGALGQPVGLRAAALGGVNTYLVSLTKYNPFSQVLRTNFQDPQSPYQVAVTNGYEDGTNRLSSTIAQRATSTNYEVTNQQYTYGQDGSLTKLADTPQGATADVQCFRYDYLQRLSTAWTPGQSDCGPDPSTKALGGAAPYWTSWTFDTSGNRTSQVQHSATGDVTATPTYPAPGQPKPHAPQSISTANGTSTSENDYSYDNTGSTVKRGPSAAGQISSYDAEGHVASITEADGKTSTYVYDADGNRILTRDPSGLTLSAGDLELHVAAGSTTAIGTRLYTYNGQPIAERNAQTGLSWMLSDAQGTAYATINAGDLAVQKRRQDPYGVPRGVTAGPWTDNHGFLGGYQNTTGLTHLGARDYDPVTGTFTTADPVLDGSKPAHLNAYDYGFDNPIANTDPSGLEPLPIECKGTQSPDCADFYYGAAPGPTASGGRIKDYSTRNMGVVRACKWDQNCIWGVNNDISQKGSHPTRERVEAIYEWYHAEGSTPEEILQTAWDMTGIPDVISCVNDPQWGSCTSAALTLIPEVKGGKVIKDAAEAEKVIGKANELSVVDDAVRGGDDAAEAVGACVRHSFAPDTLVLMADGTSKPILDVKVGDKITNSTPDSKDFQYHVVTAVHVTGDDHDFVDVTLASGTITATEHHQFWEARTHHWIEAGSLQDGDQLESSGGRRVGVLAVRSHSGRVLTYDLTIDSLHMYYVEAGGIPVLVHNVGAECGAGRQPWKLGKDGASAMKRGGPFNTTFYKSTADGTWWTADTAGHAGSAFKVYKESGKGLQWISDADEYGDYIVGKWKGDTGYFIPNSTLRGAG